MNVLVPREVVPGETRVAAVPETIVRMVKAGLTVTVESGAGAAARVTDDAYRAAGARVAPLGELDAAYAAADAVVKYHPPRPDEAARLRAGALLVSFLWPLEHADAVRAIAGRGASAFALDLLPRISRAQKMDALSSQANIAGYKAVILAAEALPRILPLMMTPAGTITPAKVLVMGAGVAGLQAIATAKRLGAVVEATDVRYAAKEQVESLAARFVGLPPEKDLEDAGGYAKEPSADFLRRQKELMARHVAGADAVITTALIPGRPAPRLVTAEMVEAMAPGSVIVDLAAERGGNCELTRPGEVYETPNGVRILGHRNVAALVPGVASLMYARNVEKCLLHLLKDGAFVLDEADEITRGALVLARGRVLNEKVAAALAAGGAGGPGAAGAEEAVSDVG